MIRILIFSLLLLITRLAFSQKPKDGTYTYSIHFTEWQNSMSASCTVIIKGDSIRLIHNGKNNLSGKEGDIIEQGIIMKHKSGKWIIGHDPTDKDKDEIGGCSDGPTLIDFKRKKIWSC